MGFYIDDASLPSAAEVAEKLAYDPATGKFTWIVPAAKNLKPGDEAGCFKGARASRKTGKTTRYMYIRLNNVEYPAARLAWLMTHGEWPKGNVLFNDGDSANFRADNLSLKKVSLTIERDGKKRHSMTREAQRNYGYKRYYGLTLGEYTEKAVAQNGVCALCGQPETSKLHGKVKPLSVDHDHATGKIRELLCHHCNHLLGHAKDNADLLRKAADYIDMHKEKND